MCGGNTVLFYCCSLPPCWPREPGAPDNLCRLTLCMLDQISDKHRMSPTQHSEMEAGPAPRPGAFGRFYLQELINSGGMADIWLATDQAGKSYALRKLHDPLRFNFVARPGVLRGCQILSK